MPKFDKGEVFRSSPRGIALEREYRRRIGALNAFDVIENDAAFYAAFIYCMKHSLLFFLIMTNQVVLLRRLFWGLENKSLLNGMREEYRKVVQDQQPIKLKPILPAEMISALSYPIDLRQYANLPPFMAYCLLNAQYKQVKFTYQSAQVTVLHEAHVARMAIFQSIINDKTISREVRARAKVFHQEIFSEELDEIYNDPCLHPDGSEDFHAMERKAQFTREQSDAAISKVEWFLNDPDNADQLPRHYKEQLEAVKRKLEEALEALDTRFVPILTQMEEELLRQNEVEVKVIDSEIDAFKKVLLKGLIDSKDEKEKVAIQQCLDSLSDLQSLINRAPPTVEALQEALKECVLKIDKIKPFFESGHPLQQFSSKFNALRAKFYQKANQELPPDKVIADSVKNLCKMPASGVEPNASASNELYSSDQKKRASATRGKFFQIPSAPPLDQRKGSDLPEKLGRSISDEELRRGESQIVPETQQPKGETSEVSSVPESELESKGTARYRNEISGLREEEASPAAKESVSALSSDSIIEVVPENRDECERILKKIRTDLKTMKKEEDLEPEILKKIERVEDLLKMDFDKIQTKNLQEIYDIIGELINDNEELAELSDARDDFKELFNFLEESPCNSSQPVASLK